MISGGFEVMGALKEFSTAGMLKVFSVSHVARLGGPLEGKVIYIGLVRMVMSIHEQRMIIFHSDEQFVGGLSIKQLYHVPH